MNKCNKNILVYLIPCVFVGTVIFYSLLSSLEYNPLSLSHKESKLVFTLMPQGWGFFTRNPRELQTLIYHKTENGYELVNKSGSEPEYLFGLSRVSRRKNIEFGQIFSNIPDSLWIDCPSKMISDCDPKATHNFSNQYLNPICVGDFLLISQEPIPWAWSKSYYDIKMPFKYCKIHVD